MVQIFRLITGAEALTELALGYVTMAAQCKTHGDNRGFERNLDRAQDAYAALRLITDLRRANNTPEIIEAFPASITFHEDSDFTTGADTVIENDHGGDAWNQKQNAITLRAEMMLAVPCLPVYPVM